jgi:hypothetical protein
MYATGLDRDGFIAREGALARVPQAFVPVVDAGGGPGCLQPGPPAIG